MDRSHTYENCQHGYSTNLSNVNGAKERVEGKVTYVVT